MEKYTKSGDRVRVRVKFTLCPKMCVLTNKKIHINPGQGKGEWGVKITLSPKMAVPACSITYY